MNELTRTERIALDGLILKEQEILRVHIQPLQKELQWLFREVESRMGLEPNALGTTHVLDYETRTVKEKDAESTDSQPSS